MSGTPCASSGQCENSALAAEVCKALAFRVLTRIPCTSGGPRPAACAPRPRPAPDNCAIITVCPAGGVLHLPANNCGCKSEYLVSWNPADIAGNGNFHAKHNPVGRTAAHRYGCDQIGKAPGYGPYLAFVPPYADCFADVFWWREFVIRVL